MCKLNVSKLCKVSERQVINKIAREKTNEEANNNTLCTIKHSKMIGRLTNDFILRCCILSNDHYSRIYKSHCYLFLSGIHRSHYTSNSWITQRVNIKKRIQMVISLIPYHFYHMYWMKHKILQSCEQRKLNRWKTEFFMRKMLKESEYCFSGSASMLQCPIYRNLQNVKDTNTTNRSTVANFEWPVS